MALKKNKISFPQPCVTLSCAAVAVDCQCPGQLQLFGRQSVSKVTGSKTATSQSMMDPVTDPGGSLRSGSSSFLLNGVGDPQQLGCLLVKKKKKDGVAPLVADPFGFNTTTQSCKIAVTFEPTI